MLRSAHRPQITQSLHPIHLHSSFAKTANEFESPYLSRPFRTKKFLLLPKGRVGIRQKITGAACASERVAELSQQERCVGELTMRTFTLAAAVVVFGIANSAQAGLFGLFKSDKGCGCSVEPSCVAPADPSCHAPAECGGAGEHVEPSCAAPCEPTCAAPAECGGAGEHAEPSCAAPCEPSCNAPVECADNGCNEGCNEGCGIRMPRLHLPKLRLPKLRLPKLRLPRLHRNSCASECGDGCVVVEEPSCHAPSEPTCAAPCEPTCAAPGGCK